MNKKLALVNALSVVLVLFVNYYSQTGNINNQTIGGLSDQYANLFTPAGYAFAIWGIIFLGLIAFSAYQLKVAFSGAHVAAYQQIGYWFALVNLGNASWVVAWLYEYTGLTVLIMLVMLVGLLMIIVKTNMQRWHAPRKTIAFFWWPISLYAGWIAVATVANFSAYLSKLNWDGGFLSEEIWTIIMVLVAVLVNAFMIWNRGMRVFALVGVWALYAIYVRHQEAYTAIAFTALAGALFLLVNVGIQAYKNRATTPIV